MDAQKKEKLELQVKKYSAAEKSLAEQLGVLTLHKAAMLPNKRCINIEVLKK